MNRLYAIKTLCLFTLFAVLLTGSPAFAEKQGHGKGHREHDKKERRQHDEHQEHHQRHDHDEEHGSRRYFTDQHRVVIHNYYEDEHQHGRCPPGLKKKRNGCMPPGLARRWEIGHPLPQDVVYYELPSSVVIHLGAPPIGHRYVQVASDILLIAIGTRMVVDGLDGLLSP